MNSMKRKTKNILACSLAILTAATTVTPVFAVENSIHMLLMYMYHRDQHIL